MRKTTTENKLLKGTLNPTREKQKTESKKDTDPEVIEYLNLIKEKLKKVWEKSNSPDVENDIDLQEKYIKVFIMLQKHYFSFKDLIPKKTESTDIISQMIREKELWKLNVDSNI